MVMTLIIACEIAFWVLLVVGLSLRYLAKLPKAGAVVLLCEPLLEVVLLVATAIDLRNGSEGIWTHGLAAVYIGFTIAFGPYMIRWADAHFAHRFAGGPPPPKPPKYGKARTVHEWKFALRTLGAAVIAAGLLQCAVWYVGSGETGTLVAWQTRMGTIAGVHVVIAVCYTLWPKQDPAAGAGGEPGTASEKAESGTGRTVQGWAERLLGR